MVRVRETRVTAIFSHVLIGLSLFIMFVLAYIPTPVLYGLFLYVSVTALYDNQMFERITLFFTEQVSGWLELHDVKRFAVEEVGMSMICHKCRIFFSFSGAGYVQLWLVSSCFVLE